MLLFCILHLMKSEIKGLIVSFAAFGYLKSALRDIMFVVYDFDMFLLTFKRSLYLLFQTIVYHAQEKTHFKFIKRKHVTDF